MAKRVAAGMTSGQPLRAWRMAFCAALLILAREAPAKAEDKAQEGGQRWAGPFGGRFNANFTVASEYVQSGISNTQRQPALQAGLDFRTGELSSAPPAWLYGSLWGSTVSFFGIGSGVELDFIGGGKLLALERKLKFDLSYTRHTYPDLPASPALDYGEIGLDVDYDAEWARFSTRLRYSPDNSGNSGRAGTSGCWSRCRSISPRSSARAVAARLRHTRQLLDRAAAEFRHRPQRVLVLAARGHHLGMGARHQSRLYRDQHQPHRLPQHRRLRRPVPGLGDEDVLGARENLILRSGA